VDRLGPSHMARHTGNPHSPGLTPSGRGGLSDHAEIADQSYTDEVASREQKAYGSLLSRLPRRILKLLSKRALAPLETQMTRRVSGMTLAALGLFAVLLGTGKSRANHASIPVEPLQVYHKLDPGSVTVSGLSSGAFFAHQFHIAYSSFVKGAGMVDGGLYRCAEQIDQVSPPFGNPLFLFGVSRNVVASLALCTTLGRNDFKQFGWQFPDKPDAKNLSDWLSRRTLMA
jgi:hypothetical protein